MQKGRKKTEFLLKQKNEVIQAEEHTDKSQKSEKKSGERSVIIIRLLNFTVLGLCRFILRCRLFLSLRSKTKYIVEIILLAVLTAFFLTALLFDPSIWKKCF